MPQCYAVQIEGWVLLFIIKTLCKQAYALRLTESETKVVIKVNQKLQHHFARTYQRLVYLQCAGQLLGRC